MITNIDLTVEQNAQIEIIKPKCAAASVSLDFLIEKISDHDRQYPNAQLLCGLAEYLHDRHYSIMSDLVTLLNQREDVFWQFIALAIVQDLKGQDFLRHAQTILNGTSHIGIIYAQYLDKKIGEDYNCVNLVVQYNQSLEILQRPEFDFSSVPPDQLIISPRIIRAIYALQGLTLNDSLVRRRIKAELVALIGVGYFDDASKMARKAVAEFNCQFASDILKKIQQLKSQAAFPANICSFFFRSSEQPMRSTEKTPSSNEAVGLTVPLL